MRSTILIAVAVGSAVQAFGKAILDERIGSLLPRHAHPPHLVPRAPGKSPSRSPSPGPAASGGGRAKSSGGRTSPSNPAGQQQAGSEVQDKALKVAGSRGATAKGATAKGGPGRRPTTRNAGLSPQEQLDMKRTKARDRYREMRAAAGMTVKPYNRSSTKRQTAGETSASAVAPSPTTSPRAGQQAGARAGPGPSKGLMVPDVQAQHAQWRQMNFDLRGLQQSILRNQAIGKVAAEEQGLHNTNTPQQLYNFWKNTGSTNEVVMLPEGELVNSPNQRPQQA